MNILYTNFHTAKGGGHTTYVLALLQNPEHNKYVACPPTSLLYQTLEKQGYDKLIPFYFPSKFVSEFGKTLAAAKQFRDIVEKYDIDIVHNSGSADSRITLYSSWLAPKKFKVVYTKHNTHKVKGLISNWRFKRFNDAVIFVTEAIFDLIGLPNDQSNYFVVENCIDTDFWKRQTPLQTGEHLTLVSNAGTTLRKGWTYLAEAIALLDERKKKRLSVVVLGRNEDAIKGEMEKARELCDIEFPGFMLDSRTCLEKGDIGFILSYAGEACSFASREMMSMGLPMLGSNYSGHVKNIDPSTGWLTEPRDPSSIASALRKILAMSPEELTQMKRNAREKAERRFNIPVMLEETNAVYGFVMGKRRA